MRIVREAEKEIMIRHFKNCLKADKAYGEGVAAALMILTNEEQ